MPPRTPAIAWISASAAARLATIPSVCATSARPGVGEADRAGAALDERHARLALERRDLLGDGGRRVAELEGGRGDRAALRDLAQHAHAPNIEHKQNLAHL